MSAATLGSAESGVEIETRDGSDSTIIMVSDSDKSVDCNSQVSRCSDR